VCVCACVYDLPVVSMLSALHSELANVYKHYRVSLCTHSSPELGNMSLGGQQLFT